MSMKSLAAAAAGALAIALGASASAATIGFALGQGGSTLVRFDTANVGGASATALSVNLDAIDFRPATGQLFGYSNATDTYYTIDIFTGVATAFPITPPATVAPTSSGNLDIDWNPTIDRMRTVTDANENIVFNPTTGGAAAQTPLFYIAGDPNAGADPAVVANAYTNNFAGSTSTQQYVLDHVLNIIGTLGNNAGTLATLGALTLGGNPVNFEENAGFDIETIGATNTFYAILDRGELSSLFIINIATRELTLLGNFAAGLGQITGLAISPVVPLPAGLLLFLTGGLGLAFARRQGKSAQA